MLNYVQLRDLIINPALKDLQLYSENASELLLFTCAVETDGGTYLKQIKGNALGIYQMEPKTYNDIWENYIKNKPSVMLNLVHNFNIVFMPSEDRLIYDLRFATAMTRLFYARINEPLPHANNPNLIWDYYKKYYNTFLGKAKKESAIDAYLKFTQTPLK